MIKIFITVSLAAILFMAFRRNKRKTQLCLTIIINKSKIKILSMQLKKQEFVNSQITLVDHETQAPIAATFANVVLTSSDETIFTANSDVNDDGNVDVVGVAPGEATLRVKADVTYFDTNLGRENTVTKEVDVPVTISAPDPEALSTDLLITFSAPQPVPVELGDGTAPESNPQPPTGTETAPESGDHSIPPVEEVPEETTPVEPPAEEIPVVDVPPVETVPEEEPVTEPVVEEEVIPEGEPELPGEELSDSDSPESTSKKKGKKK